MEAGERPLLATVPDTKATTVRGSAGRRESVAVYVERIKKALDRQCDYASPCRVHPAKRAVGSWTNYGPIIAASPYGALVRNDEDLPAGVDYIPGFKRPGRVSLAGPWLLTETKAAIDALRAKYSRARDLEARMSVGLSLSPGEAHVVPVDDPEVDMWVNPKWFHEAFGRWPARILWQDHVLVVDTEQHYYFLAGCSRPTWLLADGTIVEPEAPVRRGAGQKLDRTTS